MLGCHHPSITSWKYSHWLLTDLESNFPAKSLEGEEPWNTFNSWDSASLYWPSFHRGFFPKGGGEVHLTVDPIRKISPVVIDQPQTLKSVRGVSFVSGTIPMRVIWSSKLLPIKLHFKKCLHGFLGCQRYERFCHQENPGVSVRKSSYPRGKVSGTEGLWERSSHHVRYLNKNMKLIAPWPKVSTSFHSLVGETTDGMVLGGTGLGEMRKPAAEVGQEAANELIESCSRRVCLDEYAQDQVRYQLAGFF